MSGNALSIATQSLLSIARLNRFTDGWNGSSSPPLGTTDTIGPGTVCGSDGVRGRRAESVRGFVGAFAESLAADDLETFDVVSAGTTSGAPSESAGVVATVCTGVATGAGVAAGPFDFVSAYVTPATSTTAPNTAAITSRFAFWRAFGIGIVGSSDGSERNAPDATCDATVMFSGSQPPSTNTKTNTTHASAADGMRSLGERASMC